MLAENRFNLEDGYYKGKSRPLIYDEESCDDYYFCGDYRDFISICRQLNDFDVENKKLKKQNKTLKLLLQNWEQLDAEKDRQIEKMNESLNSLVGENRVLKQEIVKFKNWENHIGDIKREDLDKVFKMSIYEIAEAFKYYRERIKELEE